MGRERAISLIGSIQVLLTVLFVAGLAWFELSSVDFGYHIAYGREFLRTGRIVEVDPFIYGAQDHRFINANWLSQAVTAALYDWFGWPALTGLRTLLISIMLGCGVVLMAGAGVGRIGIAWGLLLGALAGYERFTLRPELFSYAILALQLLLLFGGRNALPGWKRISAVVALQALWVNLHSYFLLGLALSGARLMQELAASLRGRAVAQNDVSRSNEPPLAPPEYPGGGRFGGLRTWAFLLVLQGAACLVNPWGIAGALFPIRTLDYLRAEKIMAQNPTDPVESPWGILAEFQSPFGFVEFLGAYRTIHAYLLLLGIAAIAAVIAACRRRADVVLVLVIFAAVSTQMRRNIAPFAVVAAPLAIIEWSAAAAWFAAAWNARTSRASRRPLTTAAALATCALTAVWLAGVWSGRFYFEERRPARRLAAGFSDHIFPMNAVAWLNERAAVQPRLFCDLMTTSNVLPWLRPEFKVYITTNTFAYPPGRLKRCWNLGLGLEDHGTFCREYGVNVMLLRVHDPTLRLIRALQRDADWALAYYDANFVVYLRRIPEHAALLAGGGESEARFARERLIRDPAPPHAHRAFQIGIAAGVPVALGWFDAATPLIREALSLEPDYFEMWNNLGLCHAARGQRELAARRTSEAMVEFREAIRCYQRVLAIAPGHREARYNLDHTPVRIEGAAP